MLEFLGLDDVTLAAYRLWLRHPEMGVDGVAAAVGQPAGAVRRSRDRLVELSLLLPSTERPGHLVAVHPEAGLEHLLQAQHEALIRRHERLVRARAQVNTFVSEYLDNRPGGDGAEVEHIDSADQARVELLTLLGRSEKEVLALHTRQGMPPALTAEVLPVELRALRRGVTMRSVLPRTVNTDETGVGYVRTVASHGLEARVTDDPRIDATTVDGRVGLVQFISPGADQLALIVRSPALANLVTQLFEQVWESAEPLASPDGGVAENGADDRPSDTERLLLRLLSLGVKDEAAARHLGVSVRTVRRMVADLMMRLDARSRFQAGTVAARRGWL
ncbi:LuxR C-terminal-related transcriptional regulator [Frankia sp. EI5c]|uniref:LuxR C-terminal-related transcriptional regulator n=1 Tax=Frankia sp. EI5c TaxID=683316 RepID=UPI0008249429|nr:LuxR C-terminal-related transcriptional regulator [Frankia sp. EI5c]